MLSYHADADAQTNPYEVNLGRLVNLDTDANFIGKSALQALHAQGLTRKQVGLIIDGDALAGPNTRFWPVYRAGKQVGKVTSAVYSPRLAQNIALAMVAIEASELSTDLDVRYDRK